jgi:hypothetical protein|tara:strand:+ start:475 stop:591 length:117 start_codon:yes stop_codon:yes gene_type:complete
MQCRHAVGVSRVDIGTVPKEGANLVGITLARRIWQSVR